MGEQRWQRSEAMLFLVMYWRSGEMSRPRVLSPRSPMIASSADSGAALFPSRDPARGAVTIPSTQARNDCSEDGQSLLGE